MEAFEELCYDAARSIGVKGSRVADDNIVLDEWADLVMGLYGYMGENGVFEPGWSMEPDDNGLLAKKLQMYHTPQNQNGWHACGLVPE